MIALLRPWLLGGGAILLLLAGAYQTGVNAERKRGEAMQLRVEVQTLRRDQQIAEQAVADAARRAAELSTLTTTQEDELDALRKQLAAFPEADRARAGAAALSRLYPGQ